MSGTDNSLIAESGNTAITRFNALQHGVLSRYTVLPWEEASDYETLLSAFAAEHQPCGPTEEHLVEELAGVVWRKRRLRLAEAASHHRGLKNTLGSHDGTAKAALVHIDVTDPERVVDAIRTTDADAAEEHADLDVDEAQTRGAIALLERGSATAYEAALARLREDTQQWWTDHLARGPDELGEGEQPATANRDSLMRFLTDEVLPWFDTRRQDLRNRPLIREQAYGEALNPDKLERLGRYEVHLDRKFERTLAMLLKLKDLRRPTAPG